MKENRRNLVFFMTDQQRADTIGKTVNGVEVTPNWNSLRKESTYYSRAYDSCPLCVPSRTSLATGLCPLDNGMLLNDLKGTYARDNKPLHEMLEENGYEIAHIGVNHISLMPKLEHRIPYTTFIDDDSYVEYASQRHMDISRKDFQRDFVKENCEGEYRDRPYSNTKVSTWEYELEDFKDIWFTDQAIEFLKRKHEKPFALFVCLWAPHPPLIVPQKYLDMFPYQYFDIAPTTGRANPDEPGSYRTGSPRQLALNPPEKGWKEAWSAHCGLSRLCDEQLGRLLNTLRETGEYDNTMIVCTTDHGEQLGEHNMYQKMEMYESAVRVPALFHVPGTKPSEHETTITHLDFVPTVLDCLLDADTSRYEGISLRKSIEDGTEPESRDIFSLYNGNHFYGDTRRMIVRYPYKLIYDGKDFELFNIEKDPIEMDNLADRETETRDVLYAALRKWAERHNDSFVQYRDI